MIATQTIKTTLRHLLYKNRKPVMIEIMTLETTLDKTKTSEKIETLATSQTNHQHQLANSQDQEAEKTDKTLITDNSTLETTTTTIEEPIEEVILIIEEVIETITVEEAHSHLEIIIAESLPLETHSIIEEIIEEIADLEVPEEDRIPIVTAGEDAHLTTTLEEKRDPSIKITETTIGMIDTTTTTEEMIMAAIEIDKEAAAIRVVADIEVAEGVASITVQAAAIVAMREVMIVAHSQLAVAAIEVDIKEELELIPTIETGKMTAETTEIIEPAAIPE